MNHITKNSRTEHSCWFGSFYLLSWSALIRANILCGFSNCNCKCHCLRLTSGIPCKESKASTA